MGWLEKLKRAMGHRTGSGAAEQPKAAEHDWVDADCKKVLEKMKRSSIVLEIGEKGEYQLGGTRFGGQPDVPPDFLWPTFEGENFENETKDRPLSFIAQFDCKELSAYDTGHLLPDHGLLSFFYEIDSTVGF